MGLVGWLRERERASTVINNADMSSFLRPLLRSRAWQLPCRHRHRQHTPRSFSATLRPQRSFFTTPQLRYHPNSTQNLLDKIPTSFVFWGILGLNGAVFCLWQAAAGRSVRVPLPLPALPLTTSLAESRKGPFCPYVDVSQLYQQHRQPQKRKIVRFFLIISSACAHPFHQLDYHHMHFFASGRRPYLLQHVHLLFPRTISPRGHRKSSIYSLVPRRQVVAHASSKMLLTLLKGGIVTSLTSMAHAYIVKHRDRPAHGASGTQ